MKNSINFFKFYSFLFVCSEQDSFQPTGTVKLVNKVAGKKSKWKIVEKEFVQGKDVSQNDAWKLILLSDFFPKVSPLSWAFII